MSSNQQHWQQVKALFEAALKQPSGERSLFIDRACAGNKTLFEEVESLLRSYDRAGSFMEAPAVAGAAESLLGQENKLVVGQQLRHYEILSLIGEGGMGEVYLARDTLLGRRVALKLLPAYISHDPNRLRRFKQEARTASSLSHPNVCVIHEIGETEDGRPFIAMEYVEGVTLRQRIKTKGMKLGDALDIAIQIADALRAAHEAGIIHRDIKPENVMIRRDGYVKVLDFGLAKLTERHNRELGVTISSLMVNSSPGTVMGTAAYMSPEQARGVEVDEHTDIWSLGVVLYEMVSGQVPFPGTTPTDVVVAIVEKEPPAMSHHVSDVPAELERIVKKALRKDTDERYQIVKEMAIDLRTLRKDLERDAELDRSIVPAVSRGAVTGEGVVRAATGSDQAIDTKQLEASRLTIIGKPFPRGWLTRAALAVGIAVIVVAGAFGVFKILNRPKDAPRARFQRVNVTKLTTNGNALFASISPDGKYVAYVKSEGGKESLWLRQVESAGHLELAPPRDGHYQGLLFSPDGNFIYYGYAATSDNNGGEVFRIPVLATGAPAIKVDPKDGPPRLSRDGRRVAFVRHDRMKESDMLVVAKPDGSDEQILVTRKWPERFAWDWSTTPAWSDGDRALALPQVNSDAGGYYFNIYELNLEDRTEKSIPLAPQRFENPGMATLLPDATGVIMSAKAQGASFEQVWYLGIDGSARTVTSDLSDYRSLILTADSKSFVTVQNQTLSNVWVAPKGESNRASQITSGLGRYFDLTWAPDGKILYASDASGSADLYEMAADGSNSRQLTSGVKRNYAPTVSPDNRFIAFHSNRSGIFQIWRMDRDGSNSVQLTSGNSESNWPDFSADGKFVYYQHFESGVSGTVWKVPVETGTPMKAAEGFIIRPSTSPDGKWLGFWVNDGQPNSRWRVAMMSLETGKVTTFEVSPTVKVQWDTLLRWTADSRSLAYLDHRGGIDNIWTQSIDGGAPKQLTNFTESSIFAFDWSRDGNLAASRGVITRDVVLVTDIGD
jgi:serine/threonine protein kinase/Tol biopolymer transport system component